jgi:hypothetical protein
MVLDSKLIQYKSKIPFFSLAKNVLIKFKHCPFDHHLIIFGLGDSFESSLLIKEHSIGITFLKIKKPRPQASNGSL